MKDEEMILYQKAKVKWLSVGDRNNAYFHKTIKSRLHRNRIDAISDDAGNRYEGVEVADQFVKHFHKFLGESVPVDQIRNMERLIKCKLNAEEASYMFISNKDMYDERLNARMTVNDMMGRIKQTYNDLLVDEVDVDWWKLILFSQNIPKHAFIVWLAVLGNGGMWMLCAANYVTMILILILIYSSNANSLKLSRVKRQRRLIVNEEMMIGIIP
ncbi:hypothetical protein Tco_0781750 [Tanacetum coccineum]